MSGKKYLVIIGGPTASGKTAFAIQVAKHFNTAIVSCDSRQFYKEMNIGTAKPNAEELAQVKHHFIDSLSIENQYSVGDYEKEVLPLLDELFESNDYVVMTGGSGLFINAVCFGLDRFPEVPESTRKMVEQDLEQKGIELLQQELKVSDPEYFEEVDIQNPKRLMRAIEVIRTSGKPFSSFRKHKTSPRSFYPIFLQMHHSREHLYARINKRVDLMMEAGLLEEVKGLYSEKDSNALQTVGYQEFIPHLDGKSSLEEAVNLVKQNSRRYAKRQITWLRRDGFWKHVRPEDFNIALSVIEQKVKNDLEIKLIDTKTYLTEGPAYFYENSKGICAFQKGKMIGYITIEKHPKKPKFHPIVMLIENEEVQQLLEHEGALIKEEMG
jgi:tRNA dimethylallyltransferase